MTPEIFRAIVERYTERLQRCTQGYYTKHCAWMLGELVTWNLDDPATWENAQRWLGFVQGVLWADGLYTIDQMRGHNRGC